MKKILIVISLSACTTPVLLYKPQNASDLMRESYWIGCGEQAIAALPRPLHEDSIKKVVDDCQQKSEQFKLWQAPSYNKTETKE